MKKILLHSLVVCSLLTMGTMANAATKLQVKAYNSAPITVNIDGKQYGNMANSQTIDNLAAGNHQIQVISIVRNTRGGTTEKALYKGTINLREGYSIDATITQNQQLQVTSAVPLSNYPEMKPMPVKQTTQANYQQNQGRGGNNDRGGNNWDDHNGQDGRDSYGDRGGYGDHHNHGDRGGYGDHDYHGDRDHYGDHDQRDGGYYGPQPMCQADFDALLHTIDSKSFESTKISIAKQALSTQYVTSNQVKALLGLFWFDSSKLDLAKFAYSHTLDPQRYFVVNDAFTFESSITDLVNYTSSQNTYAYNH